MGGLAIFSSTMSKSPALPLFAGSLGISDREIGFIAAASTVVGIVISFPAAILSDIIGRRRLLMISAFVFATAPFLYLFVSSVLALVLVRMYHGIATAILGPIAMAAVADTFSERRGERMAWYSSATMVGRFLAPMLGGALIFGNSFQWVYIADGIIGMMAFTAAILIPFPKKIVSVTTETKTEKRHYGKEIVAIVTHGGILSTSLIEAVQYFAYGAIETYLPRYLKENSSFSPLQIGSLFTAQIIVAALTKPIMGRISDKYGRIQVIVGGLLLGGTTTLFLGFTTNYIIIMVLITLFGLSLATVTASTGAFVADLSKASNRGSAMGMLSTIMDIGQSLGPIVTGMLVSAYLFRVAFGSVGIFMIVASLIYFLVIRKVLKPVSVRLT
jgi:MFS transporter, DHA1 family, multidrug resistance protein